MRDVFWELDKGRARLCALRHLERLAYDFWNNFRIQNLRRIAGNRLKQIHQIQNLVRFFVQPIGGCLAGDGHHRRMIHIRISNAGHQIGRAWPKRGQAHAGLTGQPTLHIGHESGALLMARGDKGNGGIQ